MDFLTLLNKALEGDNRAQFKLIERYQNWAFAVIRKKGLQDLEQQKAAVNHGFHKLFKRESRDYQSEKHFQWIFAKILTSAKSDIYNVYTPQTNSEKVQFESNEILELDKDFAVKQEYDPLSIEYVGNESSELEDYVLGHHKDIYRDSTLFRKYLFQYSDDVNNRPIAFSDLANIDKTSLPLENSSYNSIETGDFVLQKRNAWRDLDAVNRKYMWRTKK